MADDEDLYDEFGNYIGPEIDTSDEESDQADETSVDDRSATPEPDDLVDDMDVEGTAMNEIVLHEDKEHYPSASEVYGDNVHTNVIDEDAQALEEPIIAPTKVKNFTVVGSSSLSKPMTFNVDTPYTLSLMDQTPTLNRGVAIVGHLHSGKTSLVDLLVEEACLEADFSKTGALLAHEGGGPRFCDILKAEQERQLSIKSTPITLAMSDTRGKNYPTTLIDCPGHVNFHDESVAAMRAADGVVVVVDAIEGVMIHTEMLLSHALSENLDITLVINKIDRLIVELKLPPSDAYYKLQHTVDSVNKYIRSKSTNHKLLTPDRGNVCFASSHHGYMFSTTSFAQRYYDHCNTSKAPKLSAEDLGRRLWGDAFLDPTTRKFKKSAKNCSTKGVQRTFIDFILAPLYKIYSACLGESPKECSAVLKEVNVFLKSEQLKMSARPLIRAACQAFFGNSTGFVDMIVNHVKSPVANAREKVSRVYTGELNSSVGQAMMECDSEGPLMIHVVKQYSSSNGETFSSFGRIYSGSVKVGDNVRVLGENYSEDDDEDSAFAQVSNVFVPHARFATGVTRLRAGNWVMLEGVDSSITKTATITQTGEKGDEARVFAPLDFYVAGGEPAVKLAVEPLNPAELPKMVDGLRKIGKSYPMSKNKVEESGEHVLFGCGELYLDCIMHDLRNMYSGIEIKISDPVVAFCETVVETSSVKCFAETPNKKNRLTVISEPLEENLGFAIERGAVDLDKPVKEVGEYFERNFGWDKLSARSVWCFGPGERGCNILLDDTLPSEVDKGVLGSVKGSLMQGFKWACREGPLCEEPVRGCKVKLLDATLAQMPIMRGGGQIIPTMRRCVYSSFLTASPKLMEPIYRLQIQCPTDIADAVFPLLSKRRGHIVRDEPKAGSTFSVMKAYIPVIESFGFETDLRTFTQGQAMVYSVLDHYALVPGNPLDSSIVLHPLEPSPVGHLAREFLVKTRRRKGLSDDVSVFKYFDEGVKEGLMDN